MAGRATHARAGPGTASASLSSRGGLGRSAGPPWPILDRPNQLKYPESELRVVAAVDQDSIVAEFACSNRMSTWTEYLCLTSSVPGRSITLESKSREVLGSEETLASQDVAWPDGFDPDDEDCGDRPWPLAINGKQVVACEDGYYLGSNLELHSDGAAATFTWNDWKAAERWIRAYYGEAFVRVDDLQLQAIELAFQDITRGQ